MRASVATWERQRSRPLWVAAVVLWSGLLGSVVPASAGLLHEGEVLVAGSGGIVVVDPITGTVTPFSPLIATDITSRDGQILASAGSTIFRLDPNTGAATPFSSGNILTSVFAVDIAPSGKVFAAGSPGPGFPGFGPAVVTIDPLTGSQHLLFQPGRDLNDVAGAVSGALLVTATIGHFWRIDSDSGTVLVSQETDHTRGLAAALNGDIAISENSDILYFNVGRLKLKSPTHMCGDDFTGSLAFGPHNEFYALTLDGLIHVDTPFIATDPNLCQFSLANFENLASPSELGTVSRFSRITVFVPFPASLWLFVLGTVVAAVARREWMKHL
jgi:hypothetical protein